MKNCNACILKESKHWQLAICYSEQKQNQWVIDLFISDYENPYTFEPFSTKGEGGFCPPNS